MADTRSKAPLLGPRSPALGHPRSRRDKRNAYDFPEVIYVGVAKGLVRNLSDVIFSTSSRDEIDRWVAFKSRFPEMYSVSWREYRPGERHG